ncbi:MAG: hypothetical protein EAX86_06235 [Candidatus Heimdallarchaeota archaeon]|nr:hypothetical protein [Candidatus Heimdallarchaeota archaeon]
MLIAESIEEKRVAVLPPSAHKVYEVLQDGDWMLVEEIRDRTGYCRRTIHDALRMLLIREIVRRTPDMSDMRRYYYTLSSN